MEKEEHLSPSLGTRVVLTYLGVFAMILFGVYALTQLAAIASQPGSQSLSSFFADVLHPKGPSSSAVLFLQPKFLRWLGATSLVALGVCVTGVGIGSCVGYALSRYKFVGSRASADALLTRLLPAGILLLPLLFILIELRLIGSYLGVLLIYAVTALPFCVWQMKRYYDVMPFSLEESALLEGATRWQTFRLVMLPIAAPAILGAALFSFITAWNEYIITAIRFPQVPLFALPPGSEISLWNTSARWEFYAAGAFCVAVVIILFSILGALLFRTGTRGQ